MTAPPTTAHETDRAYHAWCDAIARVDALTKVFVLGTAKSGTTWVQLLLNAHPRVVVDGEGGFAWRTLPILQQAIRAHNADCQQHGHPAHVRYDETELALHFRHLVLSKLAGYVDRAGVDASTLEAVGDKTPQHALGLAPLAQVFPSARFVHVVRDPRDGAVSAWHHFGGSSGRSFEGHVRWYITESWRQTLDGVLAHEPALGARLLHLRYEDLHADPTGETRRLFEHIGVDASDDTVSACVDASRFDKMTGGRQRGEGDNSAFFRKGIVGDWRNAIDASLARDACARVEPAMHRFGYEF